ncbi:vanomycin resistance protein VanB [Cohnella endophytica]|uniref:Vanomycin resistance protein VanB n=1 Tax=Cohnella endophytica TaxID=2419778 RepID=A0A494X9Q9_9BACL|nr:VanW family protein [Cohnella endophytica]RKP47220.1 vanomycin resistance protein VanB [Cohnella endophytica]
MKKGWIITSVLLVLIAAMTGVGIGVTMQFGNDDKLPEGFSVGGMPLGGIEPEVALSRIQARLGELRASKISLASESADGQGKPMDSLTYEQLGWNIEASEAIGAIERYRDYSWWERAKVRYSKDYGKTDFGVNVSWDEKAFKQAAGKAWGSFVTGQPEDATRTIDKNDIVVYTEEKSGRALDLAALFKQAEQLSPKGLAATEDNVKLEMKVTETQPKITVAKLKEEGIDRKIAEFTTSFSTSGEGRSHNVTVAAKALNETLLMPDEIFEYGKIVAKADKEYGYKEAPVILKGKLTPGIGGGICQVSSTLYNAALMSGLDIVERRNHSLVVHYLPKGLDATFADGFVNFKFRNSTGTQLLIRTVVQDKTLTVKLFGTMPDNVSYRTETEELKVNQPNIVYVANNKLALGKQDVLQKGEPGYVIQSYLVKSVNGEFAERKKLSKDTYRTQDTLIAVNPNDPRLHPEGGKTPAPSVTPEPEDGLPGPVGDDSPVEPV